MGIAWNDCCGPTRSRIQGEASAAFERIVAAKISLDWPLSAVFMLAPLRMLLSRHSRGFSGIFDAVQRATVDAHLAESEVVLESESTQLLVRYSVRRLPHSAFQTTLGSAGSCGSSEPPSMLALQIIGFSVASGSFSGVTQRTSQLPALCNCTVEYAAMTGSLSLYRQCDLNFSCCLISAGGLRHLRACWTGEDDDLQAALETRSGTLVLFSTRLGAREYSLADFGVCAASKAHPKHTRQRWESKCSAAQAGLLSVHSASEISCILRCPQHQSFSLSACMAPCNHPMLPSASCCHRQRSCCPI